MKRRYHLALLALFWAAGCAGPAISPPDAPAFAPLPAPNDDGMVVYLYRLTGKLDGPEVYLDGEPQVQLIQESYLSWTLPAEPHELRLVWGEDAGTIVFELPARPGATLYYRLAESAQFDMGVLVHTHRNAARLEEVEEPYAKAELGRRCRKPSTEQ